MTPRRSRSAARRRILTTLALVATLAAPLDSARAATGTADAAARHGYPYPAAPDCVETPGVTTGCVYDQWNAYQGQCVSWVAFRLNTLNGVRFDNHSYLGRRWGSANNWGTAARAAGLRVDQVPARGAVAWYANHVAHVEYVNPDGSVVVSEMNHDNHNGFRIATISRASRWPKGFIHVRDLPNATLQYRVDAGGGLYADVVPGHGPARRGARVGAGWAGMGLVTQLDDLTGDRLPELLARRNRDGALLLYASAGGGRLQAPRQVGRGWGAVTVLADAGAMRGTGRQLVAAFGAGQVRQYELTRTGIGASRRLATANSWRAATGVGDSTADGRADLAVLTRDGRLLRQAATSTGMLGRAHQVALAPAGQLVSRELNEVTLLDGRGRAQARSMPLGRATTPRTVQDGLVGQRLA